MHVRSLAHLVFGMLALCVFFLPFPSANAATPASPLTVVQTGTEQALDILRSSQSEGGPTIRQRRDEILTIVDRYFNFQEMARRSLGRAWRDQPPAKQQEFVRLFKDLLFNTYVSRVETYTSGNEQVVFDRQDIDGNYAVVFTRIVNYRNSDVKVDYRMRLDGGEWKVYDVVVEGISFIDNYRGQFTYILARESFDSLLNRIRERVAELART